ncbi:hypothetical protein ACFYWX_19135 [Streptomyces sp. NPDC002888]|uniref:hypothetical protein n=1 Tax=Streptomyces sp. NPDC002888 TaxID=3364668 RepID=UPI0036AB6196
MKKRSMLAIASLATGFVVAAITPSHGLGSEDLNGLKVGDALSGIAPTIGQDNSLDIDEGPLGLGD